MTASQLQSALREVDASEIDTIMVMKGLDKLVEFENLVRDMRKEQTAFFKTKDPDIKKGHLVKAKELEKRVDKILDDQLELI